MIILMLQRYDFGVLNPIFMILKIFTAASINNEQVKETRLPLKGS